MTNYTESLNQYIHEEYGVEAEKFVAWIEPYFDADQVSEMVDDLTDFVSWKMETKPDVWRVVNLLIAWDILRGITIRELVKKYREENAE